MRMQGLEGMQRMQHVVQGLGGGSGGQFAGGSGVQFSGGCGVQLAGMQQKPLPPTPQGRARYFT